MITKKLMKDVVTFCNKYVDNKNIVISIAKYPTFIDVSIHVWNLDKSKITINDVVGSISQYVDTEEGLNKFKEKVSNQLPLLLKQVKTD